MRMIALSTENCGPVRTALMGLLERSREVSAVASTTYFGNSCKEAVGACQTYQSGSTDTKDRHSLGFFQVRTRVSPEVFQISKRAVYGNRASILFPARLSVWSFGMRQRGFPRVLRRFFVATSCWRLTCEGTRNMS